MAAIKLVNFITLLTLAVLAVSFNATPVNAVGVRQAAHHGRSYAGHHALAKKRQNTNRRCRQRTTSLALSSTPAPVSTSEAAPPPSTSQAPPASTSEAPAPPPTTTSQPPANTQKNETPAPSSQPPAPSPAPAQNNNSGGRSGKAGIAWNNPDTQSLRNWSKAAAIYNWSPYVDPLYKQLGFTTMSMLWGYKQIDQFTQLTSQPGYADWAMGVNEPNEQTQSYMSPGDAANVWRQYIDPLQYKGYKLVGPACTSAPSAIGWYKDFLAACSGCKFDSLALHYYGTDPQDMINYIQSFHTAFPQYPIMVTEFACQNFGGGSQCDQGQVYNFMKTVTSWMDSQGYILYYFAFGVLHDMYNVNYANQLIGDDGQPNALGWTYLSS